MAKAKAAWVGFVLLAFSALALPIKAGKPQHDFHTAILQLNWNKDENTLEASIRVFKDDLEKALSYSFKVSDLKLDGSNKYRELIAEYLSKKLHLKATGGKIGPNFIGKEIESDIVWLYCEWPNPPRFKSKMLFECHLLTEVFSDQSNIINYQNGSQKATYLLDRANNEAVLP